LRSHDTKLRPMGNARLRRMGRQASAERDVCKSMDGKVLATREGR